MVFQVGLPVGEKKLHSMIICSRQGKGALSEARWPHRARVDVVILSGASCGPQNPFGETHSGLCTRHSLAKSEAPGHSPVTFRLPSHEGRI